MRDPARDDLVPVTAIVAGTVVGITVTIISLLLSGDDSSATHVPTLEEIVVVGEVSSEPVGTDWTDPRGPERGPTVLEWEVIRTYKVIESMTAAEPSHEVVDETLGRLWEFARAHPANPLIQELYLKGLRVAEYYAAAADHHVRATLLAARFERHVAGVGSHDNAALEWMRMIVQRLDRSCFDPPRQVAELRRLAARFPTSEAVAETLAHGIEVANTECAFSR